MTYVLLAAVLDDFLLLQLTRDDDQSYLRLAHRHPSDFFYHGDSVQAWSCSKKLYDKLRLSYQIFPKLEQRLEKHLL